MDNSVTFNIYKHLSEIYYFNVFQVVILLVKRIVTACVTVAVAGPTAMVLYSILTISQGQAVVPVVEVLCWYVKRTTRFYVKKHNRGMRLSEAFIIL